MLCFVSACPLSSATYQFSLWQQVNIILINPHVPRFLNWSAPRHYVKIKWDVVNVKHSNYPRNELKVHAKMEQIACSENTDSKNGRRSCWQALHKSLYKIICSCFEKIKSRPGAPSSVDNAWVRFRAINWLYAASSEAVCLVGYQFSIWSQAEQPIS